MSAETAHARAQAHALAAARGYRLRLRPGGLVLIFGPDDRLWGRARGWAAAARLLDSLPDPAAASVRIHDPRLVIAALDTETTGLDPARHGVVELALAARWTGGAAAFHTLVAGGWRDADPAALALHRIALDDAATHGMPLRAAVHAAQAVLAAARAGDRPAVLLIHHAAFDLAFLPPTAWGVPILDSSALARAVLGVDWSLSGLLEHHRIPRQGPAHRALSDAQAVLDLWTRVLHPRLPATATLAEVQRLAMTAPPSARYQPPTPSTPPGGA